MGSCRTENIVYEATVNSVLETRFTSACVRLSLDEDMPIIKKYFKDLVYESDTELSKYIYSLKRRDIDHEISWEVIKRAQHIADNNNPVCRLCLKETPAVVYALKQRRSK